MTIIQSHIVPSGISNVRLSDYAIGIFPSLPSRKGLKKAIKKKAIWVNGIAGATGTWISAGMKIDLIEIDRKPPKIYRINLEVIYEDNDIAIINKPGGIVVSGNQFRTVQHALLHNLQMSNAVDALKCPQAVHRLDHPTSGLLLIAKTSSARIHLGRQFEQKGIQKKYQAIVAGKMPIKGRINEPIEGKEASTAFELIKTVPSLRSKHLSFVNLYPLTGRTHQLRVHLASLGHPILGDKIYCEKNQLLRGKGLFLCAVALSFRHPTTEEKIALEINAPNKFQLHLAREEKRWKKYNA